MLTYLSWVGTALMIVAGIVVVFLLFKQFAPKIAVDLVPAPKTKPSVLSSDSLVSDLQSVILALNPVKDSAKIEYLLKEIAPILVDPRSKESPNA